MRGSRLGQPALENLQVQGTSRHGQQVAAVTPGQQVRWAWPGRSGSRARRSPETCRCTRFTACLGLLTPHGIDHLLQAYRPSRVHPRTARTTLLDRPELDGRSPRQARSGPSTPIRSAGAPGSLISPPRCVAGLQIKLTRSRAALATPFSPRCLRPVQRGLPVRQLRHRGSKLIRIDVGGTPPMQDEPLPITELLARARDGDQQAWNG